MNWKISVAKTREAIALIKNLKFPNFKGTFWGKGKQFWLGGMRRESNLENWDQLLVSQ